MTKPTILQIIPALDTGGAELSAIEMAAAIVRAGGRALVATEGGRLEGAMTAAGGEIIRFAVGSKNPFKILANASALVKLAARERIALIHARSRAPAWSALLAARRTKLPFVTTYHGAYAEKGPLKRLYNSVMARSDRVIANSEYTANLVRTRYRTEPARIRVIHRGVDLKRFDRSAVDRQRQAALRGNWGIEDDRPVILQAARLTGWKGQRVLIEACRLLREEGRLGEALLVLAGDDQGRSDYRAELEAQVQTAGLSGYVKMPGHVADVPAAFAIARVSVVASTEPEAFGRAAAESEAMGCPVIATRHGAPPETVLGMDEHGSHLATGWLVTPGDARALAEAIASALSLTFDARRSMGDRARAHVAGRFTVEAMQRATLAVYDELLGTELAVSFAREHASQHFGR